MEHGLPKAPALLFSEASGHILDEERYMDQDVLAVVLGAGRGTHLYPLTKERSKPAIPFGGKYLLIDIPLSNCIHSGVHKMYVLTQFNSASLNNHIARTYIFDSFSSRFVRVLAAEQTYQSSDWYLGTADAVRKNFEHLHSHQPEYYIILFGDQLYRMNFNDLLKSHVESGADLTLAAKPVDQHQATSLDLIQVNSRLRITDTKERNSSSPELSYMHVPKKVGRRIRQSAEEPVFLASTGIYVFSSSALMRALACEGEDFLDIIPKIVRKEMVKAYLFDGYWEDLSTVRAFYEANLRFTDIAPAFNFYDEKRPIYTQKNHLPPTKINYSVVDQSLIADGSIITASEIRNSVIGMRSLIEPEVTMHGVYFMGALSYETAEEKLENAAHNYPNFGVGRGTTIQSAIIDENVRIGDNCRIGADGHYREEGDYGNYFVKEGLIIIPRNSVIPSNTVI